MFVLLILICFLGGGGARGDILSLLYLRPAAVALAIGFILLGRGDYAAVRMPLAVLGSLAAVMAIQLVPLPPALWTTLPGHGQFAEAAAIAVRPQPFRPISISPELTWNSLCALIIPAATLLGYAAVDDATRWRIVPILLGIALVSAAVGIGQVAQGPSSPLYLYRVTNDTMAVGLFANRNHAATLLVLCFPLLGAFWLGNRAQARKPLPLAISAAGVAAFLIITIAIIGSRAGFIFMLISIAATLLFLLFVRSRNPRQSPGRDDRRLWIVGGIAAAVVLIGAIVLTGGQGSNAIARLARTHAGGELRIDALPSLLELARAYVPWGSGFGTFDPAYRIVEPAAHIDQYYLNHAHNDVLEVLITGGVLGVIVTLAGCGAVIMWTVRLAQAGRSGSRFGLLGWAGLAIILILLSWSVVDYPLRVPSLAALLALAVAWLGSGGRRGAAG